MAQIFPQLKNFSHVVSVDTTDGYIGYPKDSITIKNLTSIKISKDSKILVLNESLGLDCAWSLAKIVESDIALGQELYIKNSDRHL